MCATRRAGAAFVSTPITLPAKSDTNWVSLGGLPGANDMVLATTTDGAGNLDVGGAFTMIGDVQANRVAKWDGMNWSALGAGMDARVFALAVSGTNLFAGGEFSNAGGAAAMRIAKWDGSAWLPLGTGFDTNGVVYALAISRRPAGLRQIELPNGTGVPGPPWVWGMNNTVGALAASETALSVGGTFSVAEWYSFHQDA